MEINYQRGEAKVIEGENENDYCISSYQLMSV